MGACASARARLGAQAATFLDQFVRALTAGRCRARAAPACCWAMAGFGGIRWRAANRTAPKPTAWSTISGQAVSRTCPRCAIQKRHGHA
ncbi:hypothetical protein [Mycobacterium canetti]|uniref:hypothetical protein n=1 Tax=Mycobacterium canetti TaxID=78331 RepID=UPI001E37F210|nr:hypothetical protein [Mycobacterium canetti]